MTRQSKLKAHNSLATPSLLHGCEMQALKQKVERRQKTAEMNFTRRGAQQETVYKKMTLQQNKADPVEKKLAQYKQNC
jgi:hypothetical protein